MRANKRLIAVAVVALIVGVVLIGYPYVSNVVLQMSLDGQIAEYGTAIEDVDGKELAQERERALKYNHELLSSRTTITDPFDPDRAHLPSYEYADMLDVAGNGVMGDIVVPSVGIRVPIYHGTADDVLEKGAGHLEATSLPIGGASSHCVLAGHTGLPSIRIFDALDRVEVGDYFVIQVLGEDHAYRVVACDVVLPDETGSLVIEDGEDLVTLVTCTPYGINTHRLLVRGTRCALPDEWLELQEQGGFSRWGIDFGGLAAATFLGAVLAVAIVIVIVALRKRSIRRRTGL